MGIYLIKNHLLQYSYSGTIFSKQNNFDVSCILLGSDLEVALRMFNVRLEKYPMLSMYTST